MQQLEAITFYCCWGSRGCCDVTQPVETLFIFWCSSPRGHQPATLDRRPTDRDRSSNLRENLLHLNGQFNREPTNIVQHFL